MCLFFPEKEAKSTIDRGPVGFINSFVGDLLIYPSFWDDEVGRLLKLGGLNCQSGPFFHPQPPSLLFLLLEPGSERKVLTKETWFPLLRE